MTQEEDELISKLYPHAYVSERAGMVSITFPQPEGWEVGFDSLSQISDLFKTKNISIEGRHEEGYWLSEITFESGTSEVTITITR